MAENEISDYLEADASNTDIAGISVQENVMRPPAVNNAFRALQGALKRWYKTSLWRLRDSTDQTKLMAFDLSNIPTATTRTLVAPSVGGTIGLVADIRGQIYGLTLSNNVTDATNDIDIAAGSAVDTAGAVSIVLASSITKRLDAAWAVGSNQGGLDTGSIANTTYHIFLIRRPDTGVVDALFSASASAPTMPTNYTQRAYVGSIVRSSATIVGFKQISQDEFIITTPVATGSTTLSTTASNTVLPNIPTGIKVLARFNSTIFSSVGANIAVYFSSLDSADIAPASNGICSLVNPTTSAYAAGEFTIQTDTSGQIRARSSAAITSYLATPVGWKLLR